MPYTTFADLVDHVQAYAGKDADRNASADFRRAVLAAYADLPTRHPWSYLWSLGRVSMSAAYLTGTVEFDFTGGLNERQLTLTGGTWPSWAASGYVLIGNVPYEVDERVSNSVLTLEENSNPGADVAALTTYTLLRDTYPLPADFVVGDEIVTNEIGTIMAFEHPRSWSSMRRSNAGPGRPILYTHTGDPETLGGRALRVFPPPDSAYALDILYRRRMRPLVYDRAEDGLATIAASTAVAGTNTLFTSGMVGSVIRIAGNATDKPTGRTGNNPYVEERRITAVASATALTVDSAWTQTLSGVGYTISDPADIDYDVHYTYLLREMEKQFRLVARMKPIELEDREREMALIRAMESDSKYSGRRASLRRQASRSGVENYPVNFGV